MQTIRVMGLVAVTAMLTACGGGSSSDTTAEVQPNPQQHLGQLAVVSQDQQQVALSVYDLDQNKTVFNSDLKQMPLGLYSSPSHGYAVVMDREQGEVSFLAAGQQPKILDYRLYGAAPTHFREFNGQAAIFYDGNETQTAKFEVFTEQDIANGVVTAQKLPVQHHGVAEPRGEFVLSSFVPQGSTEVSIVRSYLQHGNHYHAEQTLAEPCLGLHGATSNKDFSAFGCLDGVLLVEQKGQSFVESKIKTPVRIGTLLGHEKINDLVALGSTEQDLFIVDPKAQEAQQVQWAEKEVKRLKQSFSHSGEYFAILDNQGKLNILNTQSWEVLHQVAVFAEDSNAIGQAQLAMHGEKDQLFISDAVKQQIIQIDLASGKIQTTIQLTQQPKQLVWLKHRA